MTTGIINEALHADHAHRRTAQLTEHWVKSLVQETNSGIKTVNNNRHTAVSSSW